ncbi:MAG: phosphatase PAP2 family protein [Flavobacteriales bacterium]|nr:phosphatase PAP2 family protein [Flavobacteriales bacterium]
MMNKLESIDRAFVLFVNGLHTPFLDEFMWFLSGKLSLVPFYLLLLFLLKRTYSWKILGMILLGLTISIFISDQISVHLFKNLVARYRPSHNEHLKHLLHFYEVKSGEFYTGGKYGFVSSHAANFFAMIAFIFPFFKVNKRLILIVLISIGIMVALSRIYLGVHYLSDVIVGAALGILIGYCVRKTLLIILQKQQISI